MKNINEILSSGIITEVKFGETFQTADSHVYSFRYENDEFTILGYVQTSNNNCNAVINGKPIHAFDCTLIEK